MNRPVSLPRAAAAVAAAVLLPLTGCDALPGAGGRVVAAPHPAEAGPSIRDVDWDEVVIASVCGLTGVRVVGGVGEASSAGATWGIEVVDVSVADLDGDGADDAAVLVDCLGADSWYPHVLVVAADGVFGVDPAGDAAEGLAVAPSAGGSVAPGARPVAVRAHDGGQVEVEVETPGGRSLVHRLRFAPHVLWGGELAAPAGGTVNGVVVDWVDAMAVVAVAPDEGYRVAMSPGVRAVDPDTGESLGPARMVGRPAAVHLGGDGSVVSVDLLPHGGA